MMLRKPVPSCYLRAVFRSLQCSVKNETRTMFPNLRVYKLLSRLLKVTLLLKVLVLVGQALMKLIFESKVAPVPHYLFIL